MANYNTDFAGQSTGANATNFTNRWAAETSVSVENPGIGESASRVLQFGTADANEILQSFDSIDGDANRDNCEMLARFRVVSDDDGQWVINGRASGSAGSETGYGAYIRNLSQFAIYRANAGTFSVIGTLTTNGLNPWRYGVSSWTYNPTGTWLLCRFRINGTGATVTLQMKVWIDGFPEPADWTLEQTDSTGSRITAAGWCGFGRQVYTGNTYLDAFAAASNGDTASLPDGTSTLRVTAASAHVLAQNEATPVRVSAVSAGVLAQNEATPIRLTAMNASVLYTRIPDRIGAPQTVIATIGTGNT